MNDIPENNLIHGLLENKWYCHECGKEYTPHPDPSSKDEEVFCNDCLNKLRKNRNDV